MIRGSVFILFLVVLLLIGCNKTPEYVFYGESENWKASYEIVEIKDQAARNKYEIIYKGTNANDLGEVEMEIKRNTGTLWMEIPLIDDKITGAGASAPFPRKDDVLKVQIKWLDKIESFDMTTEN